MRVLRLWVEKSIFFFVFLTTSTSQTLRRVLYTVTLVFSNISDVCMCVVSTGALSIKLNVVLARCLCLGIQGENNGLSNHTHIESTRALYLGALDACARSLIHNRCELRIYWKYDKQIYIFYLNIKRSVLDCFHQRKTVLHIYSQYCIYFWNISRVKPYWHDMKRWVGVVAFICRKIKPTLKKDMTSTWHFLRRDVWCISNSGMV